MDKIFIENLRLEGILGVHPREQKTPQPILVSAVVTTDITEAAADDDILKTVNYSTLSKDISKFIKSTHYYTIEALIEALARELLTKDRINEIWLRIEKPDAVAEADSVGVEITRKKFY
jgi:dihydroneopterin aldolase